MPIIQNQQPDSINSMGSPNRDLSNASEVRKMSVDTREPRNQSVPLVGSSKKSAAIGLIDDDFDGLVSDDFGGIGSNNNG